MPSIFDSYDDKLASLRAGHAALLRRPNRVDERWYNGVFDRFVDPILTEAHAPLAWRFDLNRSRNPRLMERLGVNGVMNTGAIVHDGKVKLMVRVEGNDRKSFFGLAESDTGVDGYRFVGDPIVMPVLEESETNHYDMRLVRHEDGKIYGMFCVESHDGEGGTSAAKAEGGLAVTEDLVHWTRLPNLTTTTSQQRNHVLHPEFVDGKYAFYTRPQDGFIHQTAATGERARGIGFGTLDDMNDPVIREERTVDERVYHTIKELKNGQGPAPLRTDEGWLHLAHGVRECAAGMRYVLYTFLTDLDEPWRVTHQPGGYFLAPFEEERVGDVSNVAFVNGWARLADDQVIIPYASADTRLHAARTTIDHLLDYTINTPADPLRTHLCVEQRRELCAGNR